MLEALIQQRSLHSKLLGLVDANQVDISQFQHMFGLSDFFFKVTEQYPDFIAELAHKQLFESTDRTDFQAALIEDAILQTKDINQFKQHIRKVRHCCLAIIAFRDMLGLASLDESLRHLSQLADLCIQAALSKVEQLFKPQWGLAYNQDGQRQTLLVVAMGKLGAQELNFSSDIDLIFFYPEEGHTQGGQRSLENQQYFIRIGQQLISVLNEVTQDGFVYRVDMRLRPYGDSGALAISFDAMEDYYQEQGREWERFAMVKARAVTGTEAEQQRFYKLLLPFVYRRYIDFGVLDAFRQLKSQIEIEIRRKNQADNIKLGAGGIREIEFIVQSLQLIRGGREPKLRERHLLSVLPLLAQFNFLAQSEVDALLTSYRFLRKLENALQAIDDKQTQLLPQDTQEQTRLARAMKYESWQQCYAAFDSHRKQVDTIFSSLFAEEKAQTLEQAPEKQQLQRYQDLWQGGQQQAFPHFAEAIQQFRQSRLLQKLTERGRKRLDKLMPLLLAVADQQADKSCIQRLLDLIAAIAKRTAYLELLTENPPMLEHLVELCASSERLASQLQQYPLLLDELLYPSALYQPTPIQDIENELNIALMRFDPSDAEAIIEGLRQFKLAFDLRVAAAELKGIFAVKQASRYLSHVATVIVSRVVKLAWQEMCAKYGVPAEGMRAEQVSGFAVIAYGKMGGMEMSYDSDLDLVYVHNLNTNAETLISHPEQKSIEVGRFLMRLAQRIVHLLSIRTTSGVLYEVDMRLRPSGNSGLLVSSEQAFIDYQLNEAWTWEHQALTRARVVAGDLTFKNMLVSVKQQVFVKTASQHDLAEQVVDMRHKLRENKLSPNAKDFDFKQSPGAMVDVEFISQYLTLKHGKQFAELIDESNTIRRLRILAQHQLLSAEDEQTLVAAYRECRAQVHLRALQNLPAKAALENLSYNPDNVCQIWRKIFADSE